jgi:hypothetical protein
MGSFAETANVVTIYFEQQKFAISILLAAN